MLWLALGAVVLIALTLIGAAWIIGVAVDYAESPDDIDACWSGWEIDDPVDDGVNDLVELSEFPSPIVGRIGASADRAGALRVEPLRVSSKAAHPLRGDR